MSVKNFDIKTYKNKFTNLNDYFEISRTIKSLRQSITEINKKTKYNIECSICMEIIQDNKPIDAFKCKHFFHAECLKNWLDSKIKNMEDPTCPNCRTEKIRGVLFFPDMYNYRQWKKQYSGTFESVTRPGGVFTEIEIIENLRFRRFIFETKLNRIIDYVAKL